MGTSDAKPLPRHVSGGLPDRIYGSYNERPVLEHSVDSFEMSKTEITNEMYEQFDPEHRNLRGKLYFSHDDDEAAIWLGDWSARSRRHARAARFSTTTFTSALADVARS